MKGRGVVVGRGVGLHPTKCVLRDVETGAFLFFKAKTGAAMAAPDAPKATALHYIEVPLYYSMQLILHQMKTIAQLTPKYL